MSFQNLRNASVIDVEANDMDFVDVSTGHCNKAEALWTPTKFELRSLRELFFIFHDPSLLEFWRYRLPQTRADTVEPNARPRCPSLSQYVAASHGHTVTIRGVRLSVAQRKVPKTTCGFKPYSPSSRPKSTGNGRRILFPLSSACFWLGLRRGES
jgi:hypothetical protein